MKRARKKNGNNSEFNDENKKDQYITKPENDPYTFAENDDDVSAKPNVSEVEDIVTENNDLPSENNNIDEVDDKNTSNQTKYDEIFPNKSPKNRNKKLLIFSVSLITVIVLFFISFGFGNLLFPNNHKEDIVENVVPVDKATGKINVLLLGVDKDGLRTDTIIVACYDLDNNKINMLSIPRDTRMYIGKSYQKINAAHAISQNGNIKGPQGSIEAVTRLTGIPINYYIEFSFDAFKNTIDALGGIDFDVPQNMNYEDPHQDLYIHLTKGFQHLDGDKAEQLVRFRRYPKGDIARVEMQQAFIKSLAEQKLNMSILGKAPELYNVLKNDIKTNFTLLDVTKYINNLSDLKPENIHMFQLPGRFSGSEYTASYWIADVEQIKTLIESDFNYNAATATIDSSDGTSASKDSPDKKKTTAPTKKPASPTATEKNQHTATKKPGSSNTSRPSESDRVEPTQKPAVTQTSRPHTPSPTEAPPIETPKPQTPKPVPTLTPTEQPTDRPSRPTPNPTENTEE